MSKGSKSNNTSMRASQPVVSKPITPFKAVEREGIANSCLHTRHVRLNEEVLNAPFHSPEAEKQDEDELEEDPYEPIKQPSFHDRKMKQLQTEAYNNFGNESLASVIKPSFSKIEKEKIASKDKVFVK